MTLQSFSKILKVVQQQQTWPIPLEFQQIQECWAEVVGEMVAQQSRPVGLSRRVLWVATSSATWAQELQFKRREILQGLNGRLFSTLEEIRFSAGRWYRSSLGKEPEIDGSEHPSFVGELVAPVKSQEEGLSPQAVFERWAKRVQARSQHLPLCPACQCPTPPGELDRWDVCALCFSQHRPKGLS